MKKILSLFLVCCLMLSGMQLFTYAETPPAPPSGEMPTPPDGFGAPLDGPRPEAMGTPPEGMDGPGGHGGMPGGQSNFSGEYKALLTVSEDTTLVDSLYSEGTDEVALLVTGGDVSFSNATVMRNSADSTGGDASSFYGVGSAILATGGNLTLDNMTIETDAAGAAGVFSYGDGVITVADSTITTMQGTSGGIHVAGGGTLYAKNLTVTTNGASSAAIRSDRGSGTMVVEGGTYTSNGAGSPAVYVTADITVSDAVLSATGRSPLPRRPQFRQPQQLYPYR